MANGQRTKFHRYFDYLAEVSISAKSWPRPFPNFKKTGIKENFSSLKIGKAEIKIRKRSDTSFCIYDPYYTWENEIFQDM